MQGDPRTGEEPDPETPLKPRRAVWALAAALAATAAATATYATDNPHRWHTPHPLYWWVIAIGIVVVERMPIRLHARGETLVLDLFCGTMVFGAVVTAQPWLMVAIGVAVLVSQVLNRNPPVRILFNLGSQVTGAALAATVLQAVTGASSPARPVGWLGILLAIATYEVVTSLLVLAALTLSGSRPPKGYLLNLLTEVGILVPLAASMTIVAVESYWTEPWALLIVAGPGLVAARWQSSVVRLRERHSDLQSLYGFTMRLAELSELTEVVHAALAEARTTLHCGRVELCMDQPSGSSRYTLAADGTLVRGPGPLHDLELEVTLTGTAHHLTRAHNHPYLEERGLADALLVPVPLPEGRHGALIVANRDGDGSATFENDDLRLLQAMAAHLATALTSCGRLDRLRLEVAAREHQAYHDALTGMANRTLFTQVVSGAIKNRKGSRLVAVMLMDLDGFKEINDTLGHHAGDAVLKEVAARLNETIGKSRLAARLGGDEFAFVVPAASVTEEVVAVARELLDTLATSVHVDGVVLSLRASIGVALAPYHGDDVSSLLKRADVAMYAAKTSNSGVVVYDPKIDHHSTRRLVLAGELQRAVETGGLQLFYQPVARVDDESIVGFEALLRWNHSDLGFVAPDEFIPVAEQTGLIEPLTWWAMRTALDELRWWRDEGYELRMSVNVSARSLLDSTMVDRLRRVLAEADVDPATVALEITESSMMLDLERSERTLKKIAALGVVVAIDDFGTGYSSLSRLKTLPVKTVKIDRSFIMNLCADAGDRAIVRSTIELANSLGLTVVAEGVEDRDTWEVLEALGCELAQGWHMARAMDASASRDWLTARQAPTLAPMRRLRPRSGDGA